MSMGSEEKAQTHCHDQRIHSKLWVVGVLLGEPGVDHVVDPVDGDTCLGNVGCDDDFTSSGRRGVKNSRLHLGWKGRVDGKDQKFRDLRAESFYAFIEHFACRVDFFLAGKEEENVAGGFHKVDLEDSNERSLHVVGLGLFRVERFDREGTTGDGEDWTSPEVGGKFGSVQSGRSADQLEIGTALARF
jgi:hypothetical protein